MSGAPDKSRRKFLKTGAVAVATISVATLATEKKAFAQTKAEDGHAHDYVNDAANAQGHDKFQEGANCENCAFWAGEEEDGWGGCHHPDFSGVLVNSNGWCSQWAG